MTRYHGGKSRIGKILAEVMTGFADDVSTLLNWKITGYCEPFCGMLGVYKHIPDYVCPELSLLAGDINNSVILMWQAAQRGWKPPTTLLTYERFMKMKRDGQSTALKGYYGHYYGAFGQYFRPFDGGRSLRSRQRQSKAVASVGKKMKQVVFSAGTYEQFNHLEHFLIYCDPPYPNSSHYYDDRGKKRAQLDSEKFWNWCRKMAEKNIVVVSGYSAPKDFVLFWSTPSNTVRGKKTECLFYVPRKRDR
jgi:site-specific DNA-adenine methylase